MKRLFLLAMLASPLSIFAQDVMFRGNPEHAGVCLLHISEPTRPY